MKLLIRVIEARNIPNVFADPYLKLQLGRQKFKSKVIKKCFDSPCFEEFTFKVDDLKEELVISALDEDRFYNDGFIGQIRVPVSQVFKAKDKSLGTDWYALQPKNTKLVNKNCGEVLLTICFAQNNSLLDLPSAGDPVIMPRKRVDAAQDSPPRPLSRMRLEEAVSSKKQQQHAPTLAGRIKKMFNKTMDKAATSSVEARDASNIPKTVNSVVLENELREQSNFEEIMSSVGIKNQGVEVPSNLSRGVVLDQLYGISPRELNSILHSPDAHLLKSICGIQGCTNIQIGAWKFENHGENLKRVVSYTNPGNRFMKALKTIEEHTYLKADEKAFAVVVDLSVPDAPFGIKFKVETPTVITPGPDQPSGEQSSRLVVSWQVNFLQSTMMKGMIEGGVRKALKESFVHYKKMLSQLVKPLDLNDSGTERNQILSSVKMEKWSDRKLEIHFFANSTVISTMFVGLYVLVHIMLATPSKIQGLEFEGLDLPDSIGKVIACGLWINVSAGQAVDGVVLALCRLDCEKGSDHGTNAHKDGLLLTVALVFYLSVLYSCIVLVVKSFHHTEQSWYFGGRKSNVALEVPALDEESDP